MLKVLKKTYKRTQQKRRRKSCKILDGGNCFLTESEDKQRRKRLSCFILVLAVLLVVIPAGFLLRHRIQKDMSSQQTQEVLYNQKIKTLSLLIYRHYIGYDEYCTKIGIPLNVYPSEFSNIFSKEMLLLRQNIEKKGEQGLSADFLKIKDQFSRVLDKAIKADFNDLRTFFASRQKMGQALTDNEICVLLDMHAKEVLSDERNGALGRIYNLGIELQK